MAKDMNQLQIIKLECKIQDLIQENDEERLINLQYQTTNRTIISSNQNLKKENQYLRDENANLTSKINRFENKDKGLKRNRSNYVANDDNISLIPLALDLSPEMLISSERTSDKRSLEEKIRQLSHSNSKLLEEKERYKNKFENCYQSFSTAKKNLDIMKKDYDEIRNKSLTELKKDPRITSLINREKDERIAELEKKNIELAKRLDENQEKFTVDLSCVKKERNVEEPNSEQQKTTTQTISLETDVQKIKELEKRLKDANDKIKFLEDNQNKKSAELAAFVKTIESFKSKVEVQVQNLETLKLRIKELEEEIKKNHEEKENQEKEHQSSIKDLEQRNELNSIKLKQQYEFTFNKLKTDHQNEINNLKSEFEKKSTVESKESDVSKNKELLEEIKTKNDEIQKFKMLYNKTQEECHKKVTLINTLNKDKEDIRRQYNIINENNSLYKEKLESIGGMLQAKILENRILESQVQQLRTQILSTSLKSSPRGFQTPPQNLSCSSSPSIQQQQQNQILTTQTQMLNINSSPNNSENASVSQLLNNSQNSYLNNSLNPSLSTLNNLNNFVLNQMAINNIPDISPPSYNLVQQNQSNQLMNLLIQQNVANQQQQSQFLLQQNQLSQRSPTIDSPKSPDKKQ